MLLTLEEASAALVRLAYPEDYYARLLDGLDRVRDRDGGSVRIALLDGAPVGCGMFHRFDADSAEVKRVYLRPEARGAGAGRAIMQARHWASRCGDRTRTGPQRPRA